MSQIALRGLRLAPLFMTVFLAGTSISTAEELRGTVRDASTHQVLASAIIRVLGTSRGTVANTGGEFVLLLDRGSYRISVSSVGYRPDTLVVLLSAPLHCDVALIPSEIILAEIVVTSEDPAIRIIRRAIERKKYWAARLHTYSMEAFTRQTLLRDTAIAAITESFTKGYWQQGDTLREIVRQKRQTSNVAAAQNFASVGRILNFNEDRIRFVGFTFVGPTAEDALDFYDYKLRHTYRNGTNEIYEISMIPRRRTVPLFNGTVSISSDSYALVGVEVEPNEAFVLPFVKERRLRYQQQFGLYDEDFWMPADIRVEGEFTIGVVGLGLPRIGINQTSVISSYQINVPIPDTIFQKRRLTIDSTATQYDSTFWVSAAVLPLNVQEQTAYATLDSTQKLEVQFRPTGVTATLGAGGGWLGSLLSYLDLSFNRIEGLHLGLRYDSENSIQWLSLRSRLAYGFADRMSTYLMGATVFSSSARSVGAGVDIYRQMEHRPDGGYYGSLFNSATALLLKNDYFDYYATDGWGVYLEVTPLEKARARFSFISENQHSVNQRTNYSLMFRTQLFRANPTIAEGRLRAIQTDIRVGEAPVVFELVSRNTLEVFLEYSSPSVGASDFRYTRYSAIGTLVVPTFGESFLLRPYFKARLAAGGSDGVLPPQRLFQLDTRSSGFAPFGVFRSFGMKEFSGTGFVAVTAEHNFRSLPFLAMGVPFLYEGGVELLIHGGAARTWSTSNLVTNVTDGWAGEVGFGVSRILDLFRLDCSWSLTGSKVFCITCGIANLF
jgi:hypothetical protein